MAGGENKIPPPRDVPCHLPYQALIAGIPGGTLVNGRCTTCGHAVGDHQHQPAPVAVNEEHLLVELVSYLWSAISSSSASMRSTLPAPPASKSKTATQSGRSSSNGWAGSAYGKPPTSYEGAKDQKEESEPLLRKRSTRKKTQSDAKT